MTSRSIQRILVLGIATVIGMIGLQAYFLYLNMDLQAKQFNQKVMIGLRNVADSLAASSDKTLPGQDVVQRLSASHYAVNVNQVIDANLLEYYLFNEFKKIGLTHDFDYGIYDCFTDDFVFGNCCSLSGVTESKNSPRQELPKYDDYNYYFVVNFPERTPILLSGIPWLTWLFALITLLAALFFIYSMSIILRQRRLSELQRDFINNMTHEFKTPISAIKLAIDGILSQNHVSDEKVNRYGHIIKEQNQRLNDQVEKVLHLAKDEKNAFALKLERINLTELIHQLTVSLEVQLSEVNGEATLNCPPHDVFIRADRLHLTNVLDTIFDNAIKYSAENPKISIELAILNNKCRISVQDWGIGIEENEFEKIFSKFYRISTGNKHDVKGFGLGLYYVKKIVREHRWHLDLTSQLEKGTTVSITMPVDKIVKTERSNR